MFKRVELIEFEYASGGYSRTVKVQRGEITRVYTNVSARIFDVLVELNQKHLSELGKEPVWTVIRPYPNNLFGLPTEYRLLWEINQ